MFKFYWISVEIIIIIIIIIIEIQTFRLISFRCLLAFIKIANIKYKALTYSGEQMYSILFQESMYFIMPLRWSLGLLDIMDSW